MLWMDFKHIKRTVPIDRILAYYNIQLKPSGEHQLVGTCPLPLHGGDRFNPQAFHVDTAKNVFNCFSSCGGGNVIDFAAKMEDCSFRDAAVMLQKCFLADESVPEEKATYGTVAVYEDSQEGPLENKPLTFELKGLNLNHPFLRKTKGLTAETIKRFGLGFCTKGLLAGWAAIPVHNQDGKLVAYIGRAVNDTQAEAEGKYKIPVGFKKSRGIINLYRALELYEILVQSDLIVAEM